MERAGRHADAAWRRLFTGSSRRARLGELIARWGPLALVILVVLVLRFPVLLGSPYPPGSDTPEETLWAHAWAGTAFPGAPSAWTIPPLYLFLILGPLLAILPIFTAGIAADVVVSAVVVVPAYLLFRRLGLRPRFALLASFLFGSSAAYSSMLTWNGGYNLFGIAMLTFFLAFLLEAVETGSRRAAILAGLSIGLVAASNFLSLFVAALVLGILAVLLVPMVARAQLLRRWAEVVGFGLLAAAPTAPIYYELTHGLFNTVGSTWELTPSLTALYTLTTPWGGLTNGVAVLIAGIDTALSALGWVALVRKRSTRRAAALLSAVVAASFIVAFADPGNFTRGYYYLPLAYVPAGVYLFQAVYDGTVRRWRTWAVGPAPERPPAAAPSPGGSGLRLHRRRRIGRGALGTVLTAAAVGLIAFVLANTALSSETLRASATYYNPMSADGVATLDWLQQHAAYGTAIYSSSAYDAKWIWAVDNRQAVFPANLNLLVTRSSYTQTLDGNFLAFGDYDFGDSRINVATSLEGSGRAPSVALATPGFWNELFGSNASETNLTIARAGIVQSLTLAAAQPSVSPRLDSGAGGASMTETFAWPYALGGAVALNETMTVNGSSTSVVWSPETPQVGLRGLSERFFLPPSTDATTGIEHGTVSNGCTPSPFTQPLQYLTTGFSASLGGGGATICRWAQTDGWTSINYTGAASWTVGVAGYPAYFPTAPYALDALTFLPDYQIRYLLVDSSDGYPDFGTSLFERFIAPAAASGVVTAPCFTAGTFHVLGLEGC